MTEAQIAEAELVWLSGRPLEAGRTLAALVPAWAYERSRIAAEPAVAAVVAATQEAPSPEDAATAFRAIEAVLAMARNTARLLPGAAPEPPDPRLAW